MRTYLSILLSLIGMSLIACTAIEVDESTREQEPIAMTPTHLSPSPTQLATATAPPTKITEIPITPSPTASTTVSTSSDPALVLVATMESAPFLFSEPANVWWSDDSQQFYYQDSETQEAWVYDLSTEISTSIAYVPRSLRELEPQLQTALPENASIISLSPYSSFVLYRLPLGEPIPIPEDSTINPTPESSWQNQYTAELWLYKDGQNFELGLVDNCFALLFPPLWSENENIVFVNTAGSPHMMCLHDVWVIDLEALSLESFESPWSENYRVLDLSANGDILLVRSYIDRLNYLYDSTTNEQWVIPIDDTDRMMMVDVEQSPHCLVFVLEFSQTTLQNQVWHCEPKANQVTLLATIEGQIRHGVVSPDEKFIALMIVNDFPMGNFYKHITPSIWLLALP